MNCVDIQGEIIFSNDTTYWQAHSFKFFFQNATSFWQFGGEDVLIYVSLDAYHFLKIMLTVHRVVELSMAMDQIWYDLYAANIYTLRPVLMGINGLHGSNLNLRYSPQYYHFVTNSTNVIFDIINISGSSVSKNVAKNTDGWDTYRSSDLTIQNMFCNGSHGISVGSLGQYPGEYDIVENVYVYNTSMHNAIVSLLCRFDAILNADV